MQLSGRTRETRDPRPVGMYRPEERLTVRDWLWFVGLGLLAASIPCGIGAWIGQALAQ